MAARKLKPLIEKSTQTQTAYREPPVGGKAADVHLRNGLIRVGRKALPSNAQRVSLVTETRCDCIE